MYNAFIFPFLLDILCSIMKKCEKWPVKKFRPVRDFELMNFAILVQCSTNLTSQLGAGLNVGSN